MALLLCLSSQTIFFINCTEYYIIAYCQKISFMLATFRRRQPKAAAAAAAAAAVQWLSKLEFETHTYFPSPSPACSRLNLARQKKRNARVANFISLRLPKNSGLQWGNKKMAFFTKK